MRNGFFPRVWIALHLYEWPWQNNGCYSMDWRTAWEIADNLPW